MPRPQASAPIRDLFAGMNNTERARAIELEAMKRGGVIVEWWYERWTFKLANDLRYTPDFVIQNPDGSLEIEETKGFWREDARAKTKMFAELYPIPIRALTKGKQGWTIEHFSAAGGSPRRKEA